MRSALRRLAAGLTRGQQVCASVHHGALTPRQAPALGSISHAIVFPCTTTPAEPRRYFGGRQNVERERILKASMSDNATKGTPLWLSNYVPTPPVQYLPGHDKPRAMSWLYRRGPMLPRGVLQKLFRQRQVRVLAPDGVSARRVKPNALLQPGEMVFVPRATVNAYADQPDQQGDSEARGGSRGGSSSQSNSSSFTPASRSREPPQPSAFRPKDLVLHADRNLLIVNKPPMLPMEANRAQGVMAVDTVFTPLALGLRGSAALLWPFGLDPASSGAFILGKTEETAQELRAAVDRKRAPGRAGKQREFALVPKEVKLMFWALLDGTGRVGDAAQHEPLPKSGTVSIDLPGRKGHGIPASAAYRLKGSSADGLLWVEIRPSNGRCSKYLRKICAEGLGCPIIGDPQHKMSEAARAVVSRVLPEKEGGSSISADGDDEKQQDEPLPFLHSRSIVVRYIRSDEEPLSVTAPLPRHMAQVWSSMGWDHTITNFKRPSSRQQAEGGGEGNNDHA